jgi:SPP1 family predicted phage head-tail adaptor
MALQAGQMRKRVTIQARSLGSDTTGAQSIKWSDVRTVWASIAPASGAEVMAAQMMNAKVTHQITMRYFAGLTAAMRIKFGTRYFNITEVRNLDERNREMELVAVEGLADG